MSILIKNALALLYKDDDFKLEYKNVIIEDNIISKITDPEASESEGDQRGCSYESSFDKIIDGRDKLLMPGLINAHTHAYMTLFRNYADDQEFFDWLKNVQTVEDGMTVSDEYYGTMLAAAEMFRTGTTCFVDMHIKNAEEGAKKGPETAAGGAVNDSGIRAYLSRGMVGEASDDYNQLQFKQFLSEAELFKDNGRVNYLVGPHAPYSCMTSCLKKCRDCAKELNMPVTIHLSESEDEVRNMAAAHDGITPIKYVEKSGLFEAATIAAHCVNATDDDMEIFRRYNVSVAINPKSNMKLGNGFAPVEKFLKKGLNVCLGTDGCGSNNTLNMFQEMNAAALIYKGKEKKAKCVDAKDVLKMATVNGAKALGMEGKLGIIQEGALADLILLDLNELQFIPHNNIISGLVYSSNGSEVETVIVDGKVVMEDRKILTMDLKDICCQCEEIARRLGMQKERGIK